MLLIPHNPISQSMFTLTSKWISGPKSIPASTLKNTPQISTLDSQPRLQSERPFLSPCTPPGGHSSAPRGKKVLHCQLSTFRGNQHSSILTKGHQFCQPPTDGIRGRAGSLRPSLGLLPSPWSPLLGLTWQCLLKTERHWKATWPECKWLWTCKESKVPQLP